MFKWLKKVMISIINAIESLFIGNRPVQSVSIGDQQVYPNGIVTYQMSGSPTLEYSSGQSYILASGDGYARVVGTLITYVDGVEQDSSVVEFSPTLLSGDSGVWSVSDNHIFAADMTDVTGDARSATFQTTYSNSDGFTYNGGTFTVSQQANSSITGVGAITDFRLNGQNTIISIDDAAQTLYISNIAGYRNVSYTSGYTTTISIPNTDFVYTISGGDGWTTLNYNGSIAQSISVTANNTGSTREAVVIVKDGTYPSAQASIRIKQAVPWVLSVSSPVYVACDATSFSFNVTSTNNGVAAPITSSMVSIVTNNSNLSLTGIEAVSGSTGVYKLSFSCSVNTDTSNTKTSQIRIIRSDHTEAPRTVSIIQAADNSALDGLNVVDIADNNTHWVLATYTSGRVDIPDSHGISRNYGITGILIACDSPITSDKTIRFDSLTIQRIITSGPTNSVYNVPQNTTQTISSGSTVSVGGGKSYYGAWLYIPNITWGSDGWVSGSGTTFNPNPTTSVHTASITVL